MQELFAYVAHVCRDANAFGEYRAMYQPMMK